MGTTELANLKMRFSEDSLYGPETQTQGSRVLTKEIDELLSRILKKLEKCVELFKSDQYESAKSDLNTIAEAINLFIMSTSLICKSELTKDLLPYKELQIHLLSVVKAVADAISKDDIIVLTDLLEYELKDNLTQWKIHVLTNLKHQA